MIKSSQGVSQGGAEAVSSEFKLYRVLYLSELRGCSSPLSPEHPEPQAP